MKNKVETNNTIPISIKQSISYLYYFFHYLFNRKSKDLLVVGLVNFILGLLPILIVIFFEINGLNESKQTQFYGDGSMIIFCFGVLVSFVSFNFSSLIGEISKIEFNNKHNNKLLLFALCLLLF